MQKLVLLLIPILILFACTNEQPISNDAASNKDEPTVSEGLPLEKANDLRQFFMADQASANFIGEGNEYASYTLKTVHLSDNYVVTYENNGGTVLQRIYKITDEKVSILAENEEAYDEKTPTLEELNTMQEKKIYLVAPLTVGSEFGGWKVTSTTETIKTNVQTFTDVIVIEKIDEQNTIVRKYFAKDFGEIKREFIMNIEGEETIISSTIDQIS
ncbi:hypothetical protein [Psychrobacillus sp.]|uniref:hypothetical protein n=1 Tax=Psychrobacillus sp. TaxID=1871623 RepID=UPI0028BECE51|nr:hypothetical protein [Psychrobacillus sp.]